MRVKGISEERQSKSFPWQKGKLRLVLWAVPGPRSTSKTWRQECAESEFLISTLFQLLSTISTIPTTSGRARTFFPGPPLPHPGSINLSQKHFQPLLSHLTPVDFKPLEAKTTPRSCPRRPGKLPGLYLVVSQIFTHWDQSSLGLSSPLPISHQPGLQVYPISLAFLTIPSCPISYEAKGCSMKNTE